MKQISLKQAELLACGNGQLEVEIKYAQAEWIQENARWIADIEAKRSDRTFYGEWPKGWKAEMLRATKETARRALIERFLQRECKQLDGAIWLGNMQLIEQLEK